MMEVSNMKYRRVSQKVFEAHDSWWVLAFCVASFAIMGFVLNGVFGGFIGGGIGFGVMFAIGAWWPFEAIELEWRDIELAINNYAVRFVPGVGGIKFICKERAFFFEKRKVFRYTEDKQFVVWYKTKQWADVLDDKDDAYFSDICGINPIRDVDLDMNKTFLIPQQGETEEVLEICLKLIKHFLVKSGGAVEDVTAREGFVICAVWVDPQYQEVSPVPIVPVNFKGKKDGRPVIALTDRKGYWILHEDGELEPFEDFDAWWNQPSKPKPQS